MGYLLAEPVRPVFCSDVSTSTDSHAENLQWCITARTFYVGNLQHHHLPVQPLLSEIRSDVPTGKNLLPLPLENSSVSPSIDLTSRTCSGVPISTVFPVENFSGVSTSRASPLRRCTGVIFRKRISCWKAVRASHAGKLKWPINWDSRCCREVSVAYVLTHPFQPESCSGVP